MSDEVELHWFRRLLLLVLGSGLLGGGLGYTVLVLRGSRVISGWLALGAGFMVALGGYILLEDIAKPLASVLRRRVRQPTPSGTAERSTHESSHRGGGRTR